MPRDKDEGYVPLRRHYKKSFDRHLYNKREPEHLNYPLFQQVWDERYTYTSLAPEDGALLSCSKFQGVHQLHHMLLNKLIKKNALNQNFYNLSLLMIGLSQYSKKFPELVWKLGTFLLNTCPEARSNIQMFENLVYILLYHNLHGEFLLDAATRKLRNTSELDEIYQSLTKYVSSKRFSHDHPYVIDFYGNLEYLLWKKDVQIQQQLSNAVSMRQQWEVDDDEDDLDDDYKDTKDNISLSFHSNQASTFLLKSTQKISTSCLSALRYYEILTQNEGKSYSDDFLKEYLSKNKDNPDAYSLYLLVKPEDRYDILKKYSFIDPTAWKLNELIVSYIRKGEYVEALCLLVDRISHKKSSHSMFNWKLLYEVLNKNNSSVEDFIHKMRRLNPTWGKFLWLQKHSNSQLEELQTEVKKLLDEKVFYAMDVDGGKNQHSKFDVLSDGDEKCCSEFDFTYEEVSSPEFISEYDYELHGTCEDFADNSFEYETIDKKANIEHFVEPIVDTPIARNLPPRLGSKRKNSFHNMCKVKMKK